MPREIANADLRLCHIPRPHSSWREIGSFALSFNGYEHWRSFEKCAKVAIGCSRAYDSEGALPDSLTELRTCLFYKQRALRHMGYDPDEEDMQYIRALVKRIREKVRAPETD